MNVGRIVYLIPFVMLSCTNDMSKTPSRDAPKTNKQLLDTISFDNVLNDMNKKQPKLTYYNTKGQEVKYSEIIDTFTLDIKFYSTTLGEAKNIRFSVKPQTNNLKLIDRQSKNRLLLTVDKSINDTIRYIVSIESDSTLFKMKNLDENDYTYLSKAGVFKMEQFHSK